MEESAGKRNRKLVDYIKRSFPQERELAKETLTERRLVDSAVALRITCRIIQQFLLKYGRDSTEVNMLIEEMRNEILMMAVISEDISLEETPAVRFVKVVDQLLQGKRLNMIAHRPNEHDIAVIDGFYDDECYYFLPNNLYENVMRVFRSTNVYLPLNLHETVKALAEEDIIITSSNGKGKKFITREFWLEKTRNRALLKSEKKLCKELQMNRISSEAEA